MTDQVRTLWAAAYAVHPTSPSVGNSRDVGDGLPWAWIWALGAVRSRQPEGGPGGSQREARAGVAPGITGGISCVCKRSWAPGMSSSFTTKGGDAVQTAWTLLPEGSPAAPHISDCSEPGSDGGRGVWTSNGGHCLQTSGSEGRGVCCHRLCVVCRTEAQ